MIAYNITEAQVREAVARVTNLKVRELRSKVTRNGPQVRFTVTVIDGRGVHARRSAPTKEGAVPRRIGAACWHAHGYLFQHMLDLAPDVRIVTALGIVSRDGGNWQDGYFGRGWMLSDMCDCEGPWPKVPFACGYGNLGFKAWGC